LPPGKKRTIPGGIVIDGNVGYLFYQVADFGAFPDNGECWVCTFSKENPGAGFSVVGKAFGNRDVKKIATATLAANSHTVSIPSPSEAFKVGEYVCIYDASGNFQLSKIKSMATNSITIAPPALVNYVGFPTVQVLDRSVIPRTVWKEGNQWFALATYYQHGTLIGDAYSEITGRLVGTSITQWEKLLEDGPVTIYPLFGLTPGSGEGYIGKVFENINLLCDAETLIPERITLR